MHQHLRALGLPMRAARAAALHEFVLQVLAPVAAIGVSLLAIWLAGRPPSRRRPDGYPGATNVAALVNAGWLLVLNIVIAVAAIERLTAGSRRVDGLPVLVVSGVAAAVMLAGALVLGGDAGGDARGGAPNPNAGLLSKLPPPPPSPP